MTPKTRSAPSPDEGRRRYGSQLEAVAESISEHAASGSGPEVVANAVMHALTSDKPRTRYPVGEGRSECCCCAGSCRTAGSTGSSSKQAAWTKRFVA